MATIVRALGIGLAATAAYLLMTIGDDGEGGANIGAGLAVFAVLSLGGFIWALLDGLDWRAGSRPAIGLGGLLLRWVIVSVAAVAVVIVAMELRMGGGYLSDVGASSAIFLVLLVLVPSVVGGVIGYAARGTRPVGSAGPVGPVGSAHTRSS